MKFSIGFSRLLREYNVGLDLKFEEEYLLIYKLLAEILIGTLDSIFSIKTYEKLHKHLLQEVNPMTELLYAQEQHSILQNYSGNIVSRYTESLCKSGNSITNRQLNRNPELCIAPDRYRCPITLPRYIDNLYEILQEQSMKILCTSRIGF